MVFLLAALAAGFFIYHRSNKILPQPVKIFHYSYFSQPGFFDDAYKLAKAQNYQPGAKGIIVNHHLLAGNFIAEAFNTVATNAPITVLLISPNHFDAGKAEVITSSATWKTPYGELQPDTELINRLATHKLAAIEEAPFNEEHGISGIVAFIKKSLPNAKVVPVIFNNRMKLEQSLALADEYKKNIPQNTLVVGSFDFSHYLPDRAASFHDLENLAAVENLDTSGIYNLDIDSRPGLAFYLQLMKDSGDNQFHLLENSNSAKLTHQNILETTSYITGYFTPGTYVTSPVNTLLSLPNIVGSSEILNQVDKHSKKYVLTYMERFFYGQDVTVSFLSLSNSMELDSERVMLSRLAIELVSGQETIKELGEVKVGIINCDKGGKGVERVKGELDNGVDVAICQGAAKNSIEFYKNKPIVYAAGDLLSAGQKSMAVGLAVNDRQMQIYLFPIAPNAGQLKLMIGKESDTVLSDMAGNSKLAQELKNEIKTGIITIKK